MPRGTSPLDAARLQARLWTPREMFPALRLWSSVQAFNTLAGGTGGIETWGNITGRASLTQASSGDQAALNLTAGNGRPALDFNGSKTFRSSSTVDLTASRFEAAVVLSMRAGTAGSGRALSFYRTGLSDWNNVGSAALINRFGTTDRIRTESNAVSVAITDVTLNSLMVFRVSADGTTLRHWLNGAAGGSGSFSSTLDVGTFGIGVENASTLAAWDGLFGEIIVAVGQDANDAGLRIEGHLAWAWGLQGSLAAGHPYRNSPPLIGD